MLASACTTGPRSGANPQPLPAPPPPILADGASGHQATPTRILHTATAQRLLANKGVTLQWIDWNTRGTAIVTQQSDVWRLRAAQAAANGPGRLLVDGAIAEIGEDYFILDGTIRITDTPDAGRACEQRKAWRFAITQNRPYFRLREFEWCDGLTDYVDIYF